MFFSLDTLTLSSLGQRLHESPDAPLESFGLFNGNQIMLVGSRVSVDLISSLSRLIHPVESQRRWPFSTLAELRKRCSNNRWHAWNNLSRPWKRQTGEECDDWKWVSYSVDSSELSTTYAIGALPLRLASTYRQLPNRAASNRIASLWFKSSAIWKQCRTKEERSRGSHSSA